ncbi:polysaccharide deacetylase family protein [Geodermatophilus sp. CPCC 205761]|uniref:polysaccharide deacetylase family protein n=1 Tax=Geodermatophilus sp. CPCC 205761 TaxID=2936597 RepID=UPI003EEB948D
MISFRLPWPRGPRPRAVVLCYHRVAETDDDPYGQAVRPATFAGHVELLAREHPVVPLGELVDAVPQRAYRDGTVAITFDDGYADNLTHALPIAAGVPVTLFVTVDPVRNGGQYWWDGIAHLEPGPRGELHARLKGLPDADRKRQLVTLSRTDDVDRGRPLTVDELSELASLPGVEIGAHTLSHPSLALLPAVEQERELAGARAQLEELLDRPVTLLAYPFGKPGDVSEVTASLARRAGYRAAFTTVPTSVVPTSPLFALPRLTVHEWRAETLARRLRQVFGR